MAQTLCLRALDANRVFLTLLERVRVKVEAMGCRSSFPITTRMSGGAISLTLSPSVCAHISCTIKAATRDDFEHDKENSRLCTAPLSSSIGNASSDAQSLVKSTHVAPSPQRQPTPPGRQALYPDGQQQDSPSGQHDLHESGNPPGWVGHVMKVYPVSDEGSSRWEPILAPWGEQQPAASLGRQEHPQPATRAAHPGESPSYPRWVIRPSGDAMMPEEEWYGWDHDHEAPHT